MVVPSMLWRRQINVYSGVILLSFPTQLVFGPVLEKGRVVTEKSQLVVAGGFQIMIISTLSKPLPSKCKKI